MTSNDKRPLKDRGMAAWPEDRPEGEPGDLDTRIYMQYLGVLNLLGHLMQGLPRNNEHRDSVEQAFVDANVVLRRRKVGMYFERTSGGGYGAFFS